MSNIGLIEYVEAREGSATITDVGDRYVIEKMRKENIKFGGENSGHIIFLEYSTTGDGIIAALKILELVKKSGKKMSELAREIKMRKQCIVNINVEEKTPIDDLPELKKIINKITKEIGKDGKILVRFSGTEMKLRVMVEHKEENTANTIANNIAEIAKKELQIKKNS